MAEQAKVTSVDALEAFRASLIIFLTRARRSLDEAADDVRRTRLWLQHDQRQKWETEMRKRMKVLDQAQQELLSSRLVGLRETASMRQAAVNKAKRAVAEAEEKVRAVAKWNRNYEGVIDPLARKLDGLRDFLEHDTPKAIAYLVSVVRLLDAYAESAGPEEAPPAAAPSAESETTEADSSAENTR